VKLLVCSLILFLVSHPACCQDAQPDVEPLRAALAKQKELKSVQVKFRQIKTAPALAEPIKTMGQLWLVPGKAFRWELGTPKKTSVVFDGESVFVLNEIKKTAQKLSPNDQAIKPLLLTLGIGNEASFEGLNSIFNITSTNQNAERHVSVMVPRSRLIRNFINSMLMQVNLKTSFVERIGWTQKDGTEMMTEFLKPTLNEPLEPSLFQVQAEQYKWSQ